MSHLTPDEFEFLVTEGGPLSDASRQHLAACAACARRLASEARIELALYEAAQVPGGEETVPRGGAAALAWRLSLPVAATLALVVASVLFPRGPREASPPRSPSASIPPPREVPCLRDPWAASPAYELHVTEPPGLRAVPLGQLTARGPGSLAAD